MRPTSDAYAQQQAILARCYHPSGTFIRFEKEELERSIPSRFERQVRANPDQIAIKTRSVELTYHELNQAANRVARAVLQQRGAGEEPIALLFEQGVQAVTAILGVLKAGKFFVPLDPASPRARTGYMIDELQATLLLTNGRNLSMATDLAISAPTLINIDDLDLGLSTENPDLPIPPDALAFIAYTSGSTGQPKGVVQNHRNGLFMILSNTNLFHICPRDGLTLFSTYVSIGGLRDIFGALLNGAGLYPFDLRNEGVGRLSDWLVRNEITLFHSVPSAFRSFVATLSGDEDFPNIRLLHISGEPVFTSDVESYSQYFSSNCIFAQILGTTEAHNLLWYLIDRETRIRGSVVPVGYGFPDGMEVLLLDNNRNEVGVNEVGEIAVKSRHLSPGYWKRPDLTEAVFLEDPDGGDERIYLTGDLGRMLPDGCLEHLGRKDFQVQVRGYRVEAAEIETALLSLEVIDKAVAFAHEDNLGVQRLAAYIVPAGKPAPTVSDLRRRLLELLPDYMVPSAFVFLDVLPMLPGGKVDRLALPRPGPERPNLDSLFVAPRTPVEETLVGLWSEVLGLDAVGIHDDFMELGGHSLLATQVVSRVISAFRVEVPLRSVFEASTVARMAVLVTQRRAEEAEQTDVERLVSELEALSDEQAKRLLEGETKEAGARHGGA